MSDPSAAEVQIGSIGVAWCGGTTTRRGAYHGPRALLDAFTMMRARNGTTGVRPFEMARPANLGDVPPQSASLNRITACHRRVAAAGIRPLTAGGDRLSSLPILRAPANEPLRFLQFDKHTCSSTAISTVKC